MSHPQYIANAQALQEILAGVVNEANQECQFSQRKRACDAQTFVAILVLGWLEKPGASIAQLVQMASQMGCHITKQGLDQRIDQHAVMFLAYVLAESMRRLRLNQPLLIPALKQLKGVYITDSTQIRLPDSLLAAFAGNQAGYAVVKWQVTFEYLSGTLVALEWGDGKSPDQKCSLPVVWAQAGSLQLFDLGYFKQERLADIAKAEAYFVSRYQSQTALYEPQTGEQLVLARLLTSSSGCQVTCNGLLGRKTRLPVRLVARRLSEKEAAERRRQAKKKAREQKKACTKDYLALLGWVILVTNLPEDAYPAALIFELYGVRWQIELIFKTWKSRLHIAQIGAWRATRVLCQLYALLIACVLCHQWTSAYRWGEQGEFSVTQMIQTLQAYIPDMRRCIARHWRGIRQLFKQIEEDFRRFSHKGKRKKSPSTLQTLMNWGLS